MKAQKPNQLFGLAECPAGHDFLDLLPDRLGQENGFSRSRGLQSNFSRRFTSLSWSFVSQCGILSFSLATLRRPRFQSRHGGVMAGMPAKRPNHAP